MKKTIGISTRQANLLLLLASAIWGFAFVAQRVGIRHVGPLTFNGVRFALGAAALAPLLIWGLPGRPRAPRKVPFGRVLRGGLVAGLVLFVAATLQQYGVVFTTAGKAGFITSLYVVFVPLLGLVIGQKTGRYIWFGAALSAVGLYLLSAQGLVGIALGDGLVLIGAIFWAVHMLVIGRLAIDLPALELAVVQFVVVSVFSLIGALIFETVRWLDIRAAMVPILYAGLLSVAVAYTLQVVGQVRAHPAHAAIILSLESVFAAVGGWIVLSEGLTPRALVGCGLMLGGVLMAQFRSESP
ncbi:MAG: DMT family transporter [Candidatus Krumholzibacteria bacterium]|nr:DMT family transporter [Candidatus Krumholzibacteria bacterium]